MPCPPETPLYTLAALDAAVAAERELMLTEIEALRIQLREAGYRSMVDGRISYKGYSYGMRSMDGIRDLRRAIERDGNY